ncbi:MAG: ribonuclease P protein component [Prevotellaceae bacterium]|nr:ribonuclease P protein component [Prevotellaceae bacterium]
MTAAPDISRHTLGKEERLRGRKLIDRLFSPAGRSLAAYPLRAVFCLDQREEGAAVRVLVSVPKRLHKRAVDRNRLRRLVGEAYRLNKGLLLPSLGSRRMSLAFLWMSRQMEGYQSVEARVRSLLERIAEEIPAGLEEYA